LEAFAVLDFEVRIRRGEEQNKIFFLCVLCASAVNPSFLPILRVFVASWFNSYFSLYFEE
jgi:hypothetical protein